MNLLYIHICKYIFYTNKMSSQPIIIHQTQLGGIFKNLRHGKCVLITSRKKIKCNYKIVDNHLEVRKLRITPNYRIFRKSPIIRTSSNFRKKEFKEKFAEYHLKGGTAKELSGESGREYFYRSDNSAEIREICKTLSQIKNQNDILISALVKKITETKSLVNCNEVSLTHQSTQYDEGRPFHEIADERKKKRGLKSLFLCCKA